VRERGRCFWSDWESTVLDLRRRSQRPLRRLPRAAVEQPTCQWTGQRPWLRCDPSRPLPETHLHVATGISLTASSHLFRAGCRIEECRGAKSCAFRTREGFRAQRAGRWPRPPSRALRDRGPETPRCSSRHQSGGPTLMTRGHDAGLEHIAAGLEAFASPDFDSGDRHCSLSSKSALTSRWCRASAAPGRAALSARSATTVSPALKATSGGDSSGPFRDVWLSSTT
jgi:hypothetical protein